MMKSLTLLIMTTALAMGADLEKVSVRLGENPRVPLPTRNLALAVATQIFREAGIEIRCECGFRRRPAHEILVELRDRTPQGLLPGALAYAHPFEGTHVVVFWDRIELQPSAPQVLGHVIAHEVGHILQAMERHSEAGVMKAAWSADDFRQMRIKPLGFTQLDVMLLRQGAAARNALAVAKNK